MPTSDRVRYLISCWPVAVWILAYALVYWWGEYLEDHGADLVLFGSQPLLGGPRKDDILSAGLLIAIPVLVAVVLIAFGPRLARRMSWAGLLFAAIGASSFFAYTLTLLRGTADFLRPLRRDDDYLTALDHVDQVGIHEFLRTFTDQILNYAVHVQGHPPGQVVLLATLDKVGLAQTWLVAVIYVLVGTSSIAAAAIAVRSLVPDHGEAIVRRVLPIFVLVPGLLWIATSPDAFFGGVLAWGIALLAVASTRRDWIFPAIGSGLLLGICPFLSYGLLPMGIIALAIPILTRAWKPFVLVGGLVLVQALVWAIAGFRLDEGIAATKIAWELNGASIRPYWYFAIANLVVLATMMGPAALANVGKIRQLPNAVLLFVGLATFAALVGSFLGYMRGEVERIWLPLLPWMLLAAGARASNRYWLAASAALTLTIGLLLNSPW